MRPIKYHVGQLEVQAEANSRALADRMAAWVGPAGEFAERADLLLFAFADARGFRFAAVSGPPPLAAVAGGSAVRIEAATRPTFEDGHVGGLAINLAEARRVRLNGALLLDDGGGLLEIEEAFTLCRKYLVRSESLGSQTHVGPLATEPLDVESPWLREVLASAETSFLASVAPDGAPDVAHRGGPPGFLEFDAATNRLAWAEFIGDGVFKSAGNVRATGRLALLVPDFESGDAAVLSGTGSYVNERRLRESRRDPLEQHRQEFPAQGRIECTVDRVERLSSLLHRRAAARDLVSVNSASAVHQQAPQ